MRRRQFMAEIEEGHLTVLCAWCGTLLTPGGHRISHGICRTCVRSFERDIETYTAAGASH